MIKKVSKILFVVAIISSILFIFKLGNSFALSPEFEKEIYSSCYNDAKLSMGAKRAKQYCTCSTKMLDNKFSDQEILEIGKKSQADQIKALSFAGNYCKKNINASSSDNSSSSKDFIKFSKCWDPSGELDGKYYKTQKEWLNKAGYRVWDWEISLSNGTVTHITEMADWQYKKNKNKGYKVVKHDVVTHKIVSASSNFIKIEPIAGKASETEIIFNLSSGEFNRSSNYGNNTYYCEVQ
jgi:hypothetical protein